MPSYAVIVGINAYYGVGMNPLRFAVQDARSLGQVLSEPGPNCVPQDNQTLLLDEAASRSGIIAALDTSVDRVGEDDTFLFFYAGHGCYEVDSKKGDQDDRLRKYLVPVDCNPVDIAGTCVEFSALAERLKALRAKRVLMLFDSCYSGAAGGRTFAPPGSRSQVREVGNMFLHKLSGSGRIVMTACSGTEVALEDARFGHGLFSHFVIEGLRGAADYRQDGQVDLDELWMYVSDKTLTESQNRQNPVRTGYTEGPPIYLHLNADTKISRQRAASLETAIVEKYVGLRHIRIADDDDPHNLGAVAAGYLDETLRSNTKIAVSCGRSLIEAISQMRRSRLSNIEIFPLNGSPTEEVRLSDSMVLSYLLWSRFEPDRVRTHVVPTGIPETVLNQVTSSISEVANEVLAMAMSADVFLFGIGNPAATNRNILHLLSRAGLQASELPELDAVGEINFHFYDGQGQLLALKPDLSEDARDKVRRYGSKFFALSAEQLHALSQRPGIDLIGVAGGVGKRAAIAGAIRGRLIRTLITDIGTARWLADESMP